MQTILKRMFPFKPTELEKYKFKFCVLNLFSKNNVNFY